MAALAGRQIGAYTDQHGEPFTLAAAIEQNAGEVLGRAGCPPNGARPSAGPPWQSLGGRLMANSAAYPEMNSYHGTTAG